MRMLQLGGGGETVAGNTAEQVHEPRSSSTSLSLFKCVRVHGSISPLIRSIQLNVVPGYTAATTALQSILGCVQFIDRKRQYHRCSKGDDEDERG